MASCNVAHHHLHFFNSALVKLKAIKTLRNNAFWLLLLLAEHRIVFASPAQWESSNPT
jgi:hypothetical protein